MSWSNFVTNSKIGKKYANVQFNEKMHPEIRELGEKWIINPDKNLILQGSCGRGKTFFLYSLIKGFLERRCVYSGLGQMRFYKSNVLDDKLLVEQKLYGRNTQLIEDISDYKFLFIDDLGVEKPYDRTLTDLWNIIDQRMEKENITVFSTNLSDKSIEETYGNRIYSRFKEYQRIQFKGIDMRDL